MFCIPVPCCGCSRLVGILLAVFWVWTLMDCYKNEPQGASEKIAWMAVILLVPAFGAALYVSIRRPQRIARYGR